MGTPAPGTLGATVAVKVIAWPASAGLLFETSPVVVFALFTACVGSDPVLVPKSASPL